MQRARLTLDGRWQFWPDPENRYSVNSLDEDHVLSILVPSPWQSQIPELRDYSGAAWYQHTLEIPTSWLDGSSIYLGFGAVDYFAEVYLNGVKLAEHEGGYLPFEVEITRQAVPGENLLTVRVDDPAWLFPEVPHGKQGWYGPLSGIWQSAWVEQRACLHFCDIEIHPDLDARQVKAEVSFSGPAGANYQVVAQVVDPSGETCATEKAPLPFRGSRVSFSFTIPDPHPWTPDDPQLYRLEVDLRNGETIDSLAKSFGFRTIEARDGKLYLNGELLYLRAALDQDYYPDTIYTTPSLEFLEDQLRKAKELGLNCLRCHIKVADPRYYEVADRMGMLIWTEIPNWSVLTAGSSERGRETFRQILQRDGHHPSIIIWTIINENWGTDLVNEPAQRLWLKETYHWFKTMDPTRLVVDNSACTPNFHVESDLEDYHYYRAIPDQRHGWDTFIDNFAGRAAFTYAPNGSAHRTGREPLILSEFGNWGLPDADLLVNPANPGEGEPWWFETGFEWSGGVVYPHNVKERFRTLGLERVFGSWKGLIAATQDQEFLALKYQIEAMRRRPEISGYVITELTDVHWECNGLLDLRRNPKTFQKQLGQVNAATVIIPEWERVSYWSGEMLQIGLSLSHAGSKNLPAGELIWSLDGGPGGSIPVGGLQPGEVRQIGAVSCAVPEVDNPCVLRLSIELRSATGEDLSRNFIDLSIFPRRAGRPAWLPSPETLSLYVPDARLAARLKALGYQLTNKMAQARLAVVANTDREILAFLQNGGRALILADRSPAGAVMPGIHSALREGTQWAGDWASSFSWVDRKGPLAVLPGSPMVDLAFDCVIPKLVLTGFKDWDFPTLVQAGIFVGWIHKPAALIATRHYGKGIAILNTFDISDDVLGTDPTATELMDALIRMALC